MASAPDRPRSVQVHAIDLTFPAESADHYLERSLAMSPSMGETYAALDDAARTAFRDGVAARLQPFNADDGSLRIPGRTWVAAASA